MLNARNVGNRACKHWIDEKQVSGHLLRVIGAAAYVDGTKRPSSKRQMDTIDAHALKVYLVTGNAGRVRLGCSCNVTLRVRQLNDAALTGTALGSAPAERAAVGTWRLAMAVLVPRNFSGRRVMQLWQQHIHGVNAQAFIEAGMRLAQDLGLAMYLDAGLATAGAPTGLTFHAGGSAEGDRRTWMAALRPEPRPGHDAVLAETLSRLSRRIVTETFTLPMTAPTVPPPPLPVRRIPATDMASCQ